MGLLYTLGGRYVADVALAGSNLWAQKTRTLLTAMGIIFGVGAVIGMLAIGPGARRNRCALSNNWACAIC